MSKVSPEVLDLGALSSLAPQLAETFVSIATDIALVVDPAGVIRHMSVGEAALAPSTDDWVGRPWVDTVTGDTRRKIEMLLLEAAEGRATRRREVNHPSSSGPAIPVAWAAIRLGEHGPVLAVGRDLRAVAAIQQRFIDAQREVERDYWKRRQAESRYRLLFQVATDAVLVLDAQTLHILEANRAATKLLRRPLDQLVGQMLDVGLDPHARPQVTELLLMARSTGRAGEVRARLLAAPGATEAALIDLSATPFRAPEGTLTADEPTQLVLVRARAVEAGQTQSPEGRQLAEFVERMPDAIVITDSAARILVANPAFIALAGLASEAQAKGRSLAQALGDAALGEAGGSLNELLAEVRRHGIAARRGLPVHAPGDDGSGSVLEVSAALLAEGDQECIGFTLRPLRPGLRVMPAAGPLVKALAELGAQLEAALGDHSLPDLMHTVTRRTEEKLIALALQRCDGDVQRAAQWLGVEPGRVAGGASWPESPAGAT